MQSIPAALDTTQRKLRVAAYIRVSTLMDIQEHSFDLQEKYFTRHISENPNWRMAGIYMDNGVTGTTRDGRTGFQRLMRHCEEGKIDLILCKSLSRFARNTLDALNAVRRLKELGVAVEFEKEKLNSMSMQSEFVLSTLAAIAQEESRSISENNRIAYRHRCEAGKVAMHRILGYRVARKGKRGPQVIAVDPEEAETVRLIYRLFMRGMRVKAIAAELMRRGRRNGNGKPEWTYAMVRAVLTNEKYTGDILAYKTHSVDYLTHKKRRGEGNDAPLLIRNHHEAIIDRKTWDAAQPLLMRDRAWQTNTVRYALSGRIHCEACGSNYHRRNGQSRVKWVCGRRSERLCDQDGIYEDELVRSAGIALCRRFGADGNLDARRLCIALQTAQDFDPVERRRVLMKREIAAEPDPRRREELEQKLAAQERLWAMLEEDRPWRAEAIEWLKDAEAKRWDTGQLLSEMTASLLRAWAVDMTVCAGGKALRILWYDGTTDETPIIKEDTAKGAR